MDIYEVLKKRKSVREYDPRPIAEGVLKKIFSAVRYAPSMDNIQPWKFILVRNEDMKISVANQCFGQRFIANASVVVVACANIDEAEGVVGGYMPTYPIDVAAAITYFILGAEAEGLGTCWIGNFKEESLADILGVPNSHRIVAVIPLGYPAEETDSEPRKPVESIMCYDEFRD